MSSDIQPGDVVQCVMDDPHTGDGLKLLSLGALYRVTDVRAQRDCCFYHSLFPSVSVSLREVPLFWDVRRFRKIDLRGEDEELSERIRKSKPQGIPPHEPGRRTPEKTPTKTPVPEKV